MKWASLPEWMRQTDEDDEQHRSTLRPVSKKRAARLKAAGLPLTYIGRIDGASRLKKTARLVRTRKAWQQEQPKREWSEKARTKLRAIGARAKRNAVPDAKWRREVWAIWGTCLISGEDGSGYWPVDPHHCYDKSLYPEKRHQRSNGILLRRDIHGLADEWPEFHKALQAVADEMAAAEAGRRPPVSRREARSMVFQKCPRIRKYATDEEG